LGGSKLVSLAVSDGDSNEDIFEVYPSKLNNKNISFRSRDKDESPPFINNKMIIGRISKNGMGEAPSL